MQETTPNFVPFNSELDWRFAEWAVKDGPGQKAIDHLLTIPGVQEKLGLSYNNIRALLQKVDSVPDRTGQWQTRELSFRDKPDEKYTIHFRDPIEAIKTLFMDPAFENDHVYGLKNVYTDSSKSSRIFSEMCTRKWWHAIQGATIAPIILATDKTQLTQFSGGKSAKNACILIAYLSVEKLNRSKMTEFEHRSRVQCLFHEAIRIVLEPLKKAGKEGIRMRCSNGDICHVYPILACYVADYPEQCLVTCTKYGTCPKCQCPAENLQNFKQSPLRTKPWTERIIAEAKKKGDKLPKDKSPKEFHKECMAHDVTGGIYTPFWQDFPYTDIHKCITLDILGAKCKNMVKILLGCLVSIMAPSGIKAIKGLLDFIYLAQYMVHNNETLGYMKDALKEFHKHKEYFIEIGCREHLNLPKFYSLLHYVKSIQYFSTTDNYNTEMFEWLHIDFAKHGWRATNQCDEFPQMIHWLSQQEKITYFNTLLALQKAETSSEASGPTIAKFPNYPNHSISLIKNSHSAPHFSFHLKNYLSTFQNSRFTTQCLDITFLPFTHLDVYKMFCFQPVSLQDNEEE
ncbi:hypothetical protein CPB84DRAFT_1817310 [Gymnopilus junonius]|uniref:Uncharacterized protein n=1 Tax=Gymnopilus junonius TaxID=109634 RepID=A0A9P5NCM8_GYMJU|nr:hypothetical protein CPB84DRAFT_1817310 [Gymnopilus junonius]